MTRIAAASGPGRWAALVWVGAAAAIGVVLGLQYGLGYAPCHLCLYERVPYYAALVVLPVALAARRPRLGLLLVALLLLGDAALAVSHVAVEQGLAPLPQSCAAAGTPKTIEELRAQLAHAAPTCDRVSLAVLGLSLAAWNALYAAALGAVALGAAWFASGVAGGPVPSSAEQDRQARRV